MPEAADLKPQGYAHIRLEGNLLTRDHVARIQTHDKSVVNLAPGDYEVRGRIDEAIGASWTSLKLVWDRFKLKRARLDAKPDPDEAASVTWNDWLVDVFNHLGYGHLPEKAPLRIEGKAYPITRHRDDLPILVVPYTQDLEKGPDDSRRGNPHSILQEYLNRSPESTWGIATNGLQMRILRDNEGTRANFVEFDLEGLVQDDAYDEFTLFWRICHATRFAHKPDDDPIIERWVRSSYEAGTRALDRLRDGVREAIETLGNGFLEHANNAALRARVANGALTSQHYYHQLLRLVYRIVFIFVAEDRDLLLLPDSPKTREARRLFDQHYGTRRLRDLARSYRGTRHADLYRGLRIVMDGLKPPEGRTEIALPGLNGDLWRADFVEDLANADLPNRRLLDAIRKLAIVETETGRLPVSFRNLGSEELGSIYESLLELRGAIDPSTYAFALDDAGNERKTTGSHYTPTDLIDIVLNHALDPVLDEAMKKPDAERALLELTVCDPTCGSGHFLIAAGQRIARRLAQVRTGDEEPAPAELRRAMRDVVHQCLYGVDISPMAVELAKVGLWLEAMEPGKPLTFLDHHVKCGNALIGAFPEYLDQGVPEQAYTPRPGVDRKDVCKFLVATNRKVPMTASTLSSFQSNTKRVQEILGDALRRIEQMPTETVPQIQAVEAAYRREFVNTDEYVRYKSALDSWCAAFTYPKQSLSSDANITNGQLIDFLHPEGDNPPQVLALVAAEAAKPDNRFFHWDLEFPHILRAGGFAVMLGNPPYLGGQKVSGTLGHHYNHFLVAIHRGYKTTGDIAAAFLRRFWRLMREDGRVGMVTTNTISKGETRLNGLAALKTTEQAHIAAAFPDREWTGQAHVVVAVIVLSKSSSSPVLNGIPVGHVSSRLDALPEIEITSIPARRGLAFQGDIPVGTGFLVPEETARAWIRRKPPYSGVLYPFLTAEDILQRSDQTASRWIICFHDWPKEKAATFEEAFDVVARTVQPVRQDVNRVAHKTRWWLFGEYRKALREKTASLEDVIVRPGHSETPVFLRVPNQFVFNNSLFVIAVDDWETSGTLNSAIHEVWYRKQGSGMKQDIRYTPGSCFETFPVPKKSKVVGELGEQFQTALLGASARRQIGITPVWNLVNDPSCQDDDVEKIRYLRNQLTAAVSEAFDMTGIDFRFGHYKDHADRWRYTMHPEAAEDIYLHLVRLNAKHASLTAFDERTSGPHEERPGESVDAKGTQVRLSTK